ncbi:MAG: RNA polymerase sigma factor [Armatimonadota bacterium]
MIEPTDEELMLLARDGDEEAFDTLVRRHRGPLLNFIYRYVGDREAAEDLSQDVFVRLWSNAPTYVPLAKFTTFIYHIARNLCQDYMDKSRRLPSISSLSQEITDGRGRVHLLEEGLKDRSRGPEDELMMAETQAEIQAAINALPEDQRLVLVLTEMQGLSYQETARIVGCPVGTVASRKSTALRFLRDRLIRVQHEIGGVP